MPRKTAQQQVVEDLTAALELLGPNGEHWIQGAYQRQGQNFCAAGAVLSVCRDDKERQRRAFGRLRALVPTDCVGLISFNDTRSSFTAVRNLFLRAIAANQAR